MDFKYHDTARAEFVLKNGFTDNHIFNDARILALYYRDVLGYKPKKRAEELYEFFSKNIPDFNEVLFYKLINKALNIAKNKKKKLIDIDYIPIYKSEIEYIKNLSLEDNIKKVLLACLVKIKINKRISEILTEETYEGYFLSKNLSDNDILKISNVTKSKKKLNIFYILESEGYITTYYSGSTRMNIFYDIPVDETEVALQIKDYNNIGYYYDYYIGKNIKFCEICGMPFRPKAKNGKYCKEHQGYQPVNDIKTKIITCMDCGKEIEVDARNNTKTRCDECYKIYRREKVKEAKDRWKYRATK